MRRSGNYDATLRSAIDIFAARGLVPTIETVAEHSGVSIRSLYRYFGDNQTMINEAISLIVGQAAVIGKVDNVGEGPLADRITAGVAGRFRAYHHLRPVLRAANANNPEIDVVRRRSRAMLTTQFTLQFAPELSQLGTAEREQTIQAGSAVCSLEFINLLTDRQPLSDDEAREIVCRLLTQVLIPAAV
jgi:AcrR family transcriptional regulator